MKTNKILLTVYVIIAIAVIHHYVSVHDVSDKSGQEIFIPDSGMDIPSTLRDFHGNTMVQNLVAYKEPARNINNPDFSAGYTYFNTMQWHRSTRD